MNNAYSTEHRELALSALSTIREPLFCVSELETASFYEGVTRFRTAS